MTEWVETSIASAGTAGHEWLAQQRTKALCQAAVAWSRAVERYQYLEKRYHLKGLAGDVELPEDVTVANRECVRCEKALLKAVEAWEGEDD